jgi:predicted dehydrogenase
VGSRSQDSADRFAAEYSIPNAHGSYEALCASPDVDAVYVATPHPMHADNAILAIEHGKHVLVEKPFTLNATEAEQIREAASRRGVFVMEAMWTRFLPMMRRIMEIVESNAIGTPRVLLADHNQYLPWEKARRVQDPELGGGALLDLGIYPLSFANRVFGDPATVTARGTLTEHGVDEMVAMTLEYGDGAQAVLHTGSLTAGPNTAALIGTDGWIAIDSVWYNQTTFSRYDREGAVVERYTDRVDGRGMQYQALEVERCVAVGETESPTMSLAETVSIMRTMDEIRRQIGVIYPQERDT